MDNVYATTLHLTLMNVCYTLQDIKFKWESNKASSNLNKHRASFETACEAFFDPLFIVVDAGVVEGDQREAVIRMTVNWRLLFVVYVMVDDVVRIISARKATANQRRQYENQ